MSIVSELSKKAVIERHGNVKNIRLGPAEYEQYSEEVGEKDSTRPVYFYGIGRKILVEKMSEDGIELK